MENFIKAIEKSWGKDTAYRKDAPYWTPENPSRGQCAITALLVNEYYGGKIYSGVSDNGIYHYWNVINGEKIDLTEKQFEEKLVFNNIQEWDRESLFNTGDVLARYTILKERFSKNIRKLSGGE